MEWEEKLIWNYSTAAVGDNPARCRLTGALHCTVMGELHNTRCLNTETI